MHNMDVSRKHARYKNARFKRLHSVLFHFCKILEKTKQVTEDRSFLGLGMGMWGDYKG